MSYSLRQIVPESKFCHGLQLDVFDQIIPFSVISQVLSTCDAWEKRERNLNMVAVIWTIIAMGLLPNLSIPHVLQKMAQGLRYIWPDPDIRLPTASALSNPCASYLSRFASHVPPDKRREPFALACG